MSEFPGKGKVAVLKTSPETVLDDIEKLMKLADFEAALPKENTGAQSGRAARIARRRLPLPSGPRPTHPAARRRTGYAGGLAGRPMRIARAATKRNTNAGVQG